MRAISLCLFLMLAPTAAFAQTQVTAFRPSMHGFRFHNAFAHVAHGSIGVGSAQIPIGDAAQGLCGGMVYAARDYFEASCVRPPDEVSPDSGVLYDYLVARLYDSFDLPSGPLSYMYLMNPAVSDHDTWWAGLVGQHGRAWITINQQWPSIKRALDQGRVVPLGLVMVKSVDPSKLGKNHQVLAYGYDLAGSNLAIRVYDPNAPGDDGARIQLDIGNPSGTTAMQLVHGSGAARTVFAFFATGGTGHRPPPGCANAAARPSRTLTGDFDGDYTSDTLRYVPDGHGWFLGRGQPTELSWSFVGDTRGFGPLATEPFWAGRFSQSTRSEVLFYQPRDGNWFLGTYQFGTLTWSFAGNTAAAGNLMDGRHKFFSGDFDGDGRLDLLFYSGNDANWVLGTWVVGAATGASGAMTWTFAGNSAAFGDLLDGRHGFHTGDFDGDGKTDVLFYSAGDGNWFLGSLAAAGLTWTFAGNTAAFGDLLDGRHEFHSGDFDGNGRGDLLLYSAGDSNWFLGSGAAAGLAWTFAGNTAGFGNLLDGWHRFFVADFDSNGRTDVLFYYAGDHNWYLGAGAAAGLSWNFAGNTAGFGDLLDGRHEFFIGDHDRDGQSDLLLHQIDAGYWFRGGHAGQRLLWKYNGRF